MLQRFDIHLTIIDDKEANSSPQAQSHHDPIKQREAKMAVQFHQWLADKQILPGGLVIKSPQQLAGELAQRRYGLKLLLVSDPAFDVLPLLERSGFEVSPRDYRQSLGLTMAVREYEDADNRIRLLAWNVLPSPTQGQLTYYRGAHGALYIFNILNKTALKPWPHLHQLVQQTSGLVPSVLVGHKEGRRGRRQVTRRQGNVLAQKLGIPYFETRSPRGPTLEDALATLVPQMFRTSPVSEISR